MWFLFWTWPKWNFAPILIFLMRRTQRLWMLYFRHLRLLFPILCQNYIQIICSKVKSWPISIRVLFKFSQLTKPHKARSFTFPLLIFNFWFARIIISWPGSCHDFDILNPTRSFKCWTCAFFWLYWRNLVITRARTFRVKFKPFSLCIHKRWAIIVLCTCLNNRCVGAWA